MKLAILTVTIFMALLASGQRDTLFEQSVQRILREYTNNFKGFIGKQSLSGAPKRLFINQGIQGGVDELQIWGDTNFVYSSVIQPQRDSFSTRRKVVQLDEQLQTVLGNNFTREVVNLSFSEKQEKPLVFKSGNVEIYVVVGKLKNNEYMTLLIFNGHG